MIHLKPNMRPCEFRRGRKREVCRGTPELRQGFGGSFYAICTQCHSSTGGHAHVKDGVMGSDWSREGAIREWNRIQALLDEGGA